MKNIIQEYNNLGLKIQDIWIGSEPENTDLEDYTA